MNRVIKTDLKNILSLISTAQDYGFDDEILFDTFSQMMGNQLTFEEIEWYARIIEQEEGYGEDDYLAICERLKKFKENYINNLVD